MLVALILAQVAYPPAVTRADLNAVIAPTCNTVPPMDTATGTVGAAAPCTPRSDATRKTVIQAKDTVTASDATYSVVWDQPYPTTPVYADARVSGTAQPFICTVTATTTGATGKCFQLVTTQLPGVATSLLGLVVSPIANAASGLSVRVVARQ